MNIDHKKPENRPLYIFALMEILQHSQIVSMISFRMSTVFISVIRPITPRSLARTLSSPASGPIKEAVMTGHGSF